MDMDDSAGIDAAPALPASALLAVLGGCLVLAAAALAVPRLVAELPAAALLGGGAGAGLVLWALALVLGLRRAKPLWVLGSLALLLAVGLGAGILADRRYVATDSQEASSFAETEFAPDGSIVLPPGVATRGPISRRYADAVTALAADRRAYAAALGGLGLAGLNSPYELTRDPGVVADCTRIDGIRTLAAQNDKRQASRAAALVAAIDASNLPEELRAGMRTMAPGTGDAAQRALAVETEMLDATQALCALLARRSWYDDGGYFGFRNAADGAAFRALTERRRKAAGDAEALQQELVARMTKGRDAVREVLSR